MGGGGEILTTAEVRTQARELVRIIEERDDNDVLTLGVSSLKGLVELMRDFAVITHASDPHSENSAAVNKLIDYVDLNMRQTVEPSAYGHFKTTYLADVFDVSVTAINNWIDEGRFVGYQREPNKHARIPHLTPFQHRDGTVEPLGLIVDRYRLQESKSFADDDERALLNNEIECLREKYGGRDLEEAFNFKNLTSEQESDVSHWRFYRARLKEL